MDNQRARDVLSAYRPNGADRGDHTFAEALEHARADSQLHTWFENELAGDRAIAATLRSVRAPQDLKVRLLADAVEPRRTRWALDWKTGLAGLAAAASIALAFFTLWPRQPVSSFDTIIAAAAAESANAPDLSFYSSSSGELIAWLKANDAPPPGVLPPGLAKLQTVGCRKLDWKGVPASLVGFRMESSVPHGRTGAGGESMLFLYTVNQSSCSGGAAGRQPVVFARHDQSIATWRDRTRFYIAVANVPEETLRTILEPPVAVAAYQESSDNFRAGKSPRSLTAGHVVVSSHHL